METAYSTCARTPSELALIFSLALVVASGLLSAFAAGIVLRAAPQLGLVQHANSRSSHVIPTPTGGGIGFIAGFLVACLIIPPTRPGLIIVLGLALFIALVGLIDDLKSLPARFRLAVHFIAIGALVWTSGATGILFAQQDLMVLALEAGILVLIGVWWLNLYNFMDGIDGLAASQAVCMLAGALVLSLFAAPEVISDPLWWQMGMLASAVAGFLLLNWPPARIFMGDVGSTFLGFTIFAFALLSAAADWLSLAQWAILGALFAADAGITLLRRALSGEHVMQAHKSHTYQILSRRWGAHRPVVLLLCAINLLILIPLAWVAGEIADFSWIMVAGVYAVLSIIIVSLGAGLPGHD